MSRPLALAVVTLAVLVAAPSAMADGEPIVTVDVTGEAARFAYDALAITGADGGMTSFAHAAAGRLSYALPNVDDEVVVAFVPGDPHEPYVVGLLWQEDRPDGGRVAFPVTSRGRLLTCSACP